REKIVNADVVITTAAIPGRPAPKLVTDDMVEAMRGGSVIVDLAVASGGNCTLSEAGQIVQKHGVTIIGKLEIPSLVAANATDMYAKNVLNLVGDMVDKEKGFHFDFEDEVVTGSVVCHKGEICHARVRDAHGLSPLNTPQEA
ncbi:NAD(P)(+) transhydrogenase (Re/Si-specific) subunit alpha, partial [bacterium]